MKDLFLYFFFLQVFFLSGQTFYVSPSGNNTRTSIQAQNSTTPWKTIQYACDNAVPGCTIAVMTGTYLEEITFSVSGTAGNFITLINNASDLVTISGNNLARTLMTITNKNYLRIQGLHFSNAVGNNSTGLLVEGTSHHIEILNNVFSGISWTATVGAIPTATKNAQPLIVYGTNGSLAIHDLLISGNELYNNRPGFSEVLAINGNVDGFSVLNNLVHHNENIGIDIIGHEGTSPNASTDQARNGTIKGNTVYKCSSVYDGSAAGIYVDGGKDLVIENNSSYRNDWGIEIGCENPGTTTSGITVRNNLIFRNTKAGLQMGGYDGPVNTGKVINSTIRHNTFFANDTANGGNGEIALSYTENCSVTNNLIYSSRNKMVSDSWGGGSSLAISFDYNLYYALSGASNTLVFDLNGTTYTGFNNYKSNASQDANSFYQDPLLVNNSTAWPDLHLTNLSMARDAGDPSFTSASGEVDLDDQVRIDNGRVDIGADEFQTTLGLEYENNFPDQDLIQSVCLVYPNPSKGEFRSSLENVKLAYVFSVDGRLLGQMKQQGTIYMLPENLPAGRYEIILQSEFQRCSTIIIKE